METKGFFEIRGTPEELLPRLSGKILKDNGFVYFADFGDGTIKVGMTRGIKSRIKNFSKTAESYGKPSPQRFGISPVLTNHEIVEKLIHKELSRYWIERELFGVTEDFVDKAVANVLMNVLRSCMWPACKGYFNHYGKESAKPKHFEVDNTFSFKLPLRLEK
jgi:hypothetical protein